MRRIKVAAGLVAALSLVIFAGRAQAQVTDRINDDDVKHILTRLDQTAGTFRKSLDHGLDRSSLDGTRREDRINDFVKNFAKTTDRLKEKFNDHNQASGLVRDVLVSAQDIDRFMAEHRLSSQAQDDWSNVRGVLDDLARAYSVTWSWNGTPEVSRVGDKDVKSLLGRIESAADRFRSSLKSALDHSSVDGSGGEDEINGYVHEFERATDNWKSHFGDHDTASNDAEEVLRRAQAIDDFMAEHPLTDRAQQDWSSLRTTLDELAQAYNVSWSW